MYSRHGTSVVSRLTSLIEVPSSGCLSSNPPSKSIRDLATPQRARMKYTAAVNSKLMKVAVLGAAGRVGSCLSLLLKQSPLIDELAVYDATSVAGLSLELSHIDTRCRIGAPVGCEPSLRETLEDAKVVVIAAGKPRSKKLQGDDLLKANANILSDLIPSIVSYCPRAMVAVATSPINSLIPLISEMYKRAGVYEHSRLFGVTTLDCVRANTFAAEILGMEPECVAVPVIGGSCPETCVPVFSRAKPCNEFTAEETSKLTRAVRTSEEEVSKEYGLEGSPSLAMAFAAARFCISLCKALRDQRGVIECAYVRSCAIPEVTYFAAPLELGPNGVQKYLGVPPLDDRECRLLSTAIPALKRAIKRGETLALGSRISSSEICSTKVDLSPGTGQTMTTGLRPQNSGPLPTIVEP